MKTIATISTPVGKGAIAVVRMSGDKALEIASRIFSTKKLASFKDASPNYMYYGTADIGKFKDNILAVYFKAPHSYTGEDLVEFQCHGGVRLVSELLRRCIDLGCDVADKGEFTKRAFLNGKIALSDAEGIIDMINGESSAALNAGYRLSSGDIARKITSLQDRLLDCVSHLEASLDYPEEMEDEARADGKAVSKDIADVLKKLLNTSRTGGYIRQGINVAIIGQANVGKSSLLNALLGKQRAIVTEIAGTTRDSLEETLEVKGVLLRLIDTAGIRETSDVVEAIGVERSIEALYSDTRDGVRISAKKGQGIDELKEKIVDTVIGTLDSSGDVITNERHAQAIARALESVTNASLNIDTLPTECVLIDLRDAYVALGEITGTTATEEIVDRIFSKFCLGK